MKQASAEIAASCRLRDVLWDHTQLYLIMDYVEQDLRHFMDTDPRSRSISTVKVLSLSFSVEPCRHLLRPLPQDGCPF